MMRGHFVLVHMYNITYVSISVTLLHNMFPCMCRFITPSCAIMMQCRDQTMPPWTSASPFSRLGAIQGCPSDSVTDLCTSVFLHTAVLRRDALVLWVTIQISLCAVSSSTSGLPWHDITWATVNFFKLVCDLL